MDVTNVDAESAAPTPNQRPRRPVRSWLLPTAVAVLVAAAAIGVTALIHRQDATPTAGPVAVATLTASPAPSAPPAPPAPSQTTGSPAPSTSVSAPAGPTEQPKSAVPWAHVGPGWSVASWFTSPAVQRASGSSATVYLVSPTGTRYAMASIPAAAAVLDVSQDGRRLLTSSSDDAAVAEWDLAAGTSRSIRVGEHSSVRYTKPDARALLVDVISYGTPAVQRRGLDGALQLTLPVGGASQSPDGTVLVASSNAGLVVLGNATGTSVRTLPLPAGYPSCSVVGWWPDGRALARCDKADSSAEDLFLYPTSGAAATRLTAADHASPPMGLGFTGAWPLSTGTLVQEAVGCGSGPLGVLTSPSTATQVQFRLPPNLTLRKANPQLVDVVGDVGSFDVQVGDCESDEAHALMADDLATGQAQVLLGPGVNGGTVGPVAVIDPYR